jgi:H2-forming N5,N10-methylenetetrahydromethanopterin dehydrogenase-like enzyme
MKIAFIGQKGIPAKFGGVEKHVDDLAVHLAQAGHDVYVYTRANYTENDLHQYKGVT